MKKNVRILSVVSILIFAISLNLSAQKCKFDYEKKDPLTGAQTKGISFNVKLWWQLGINKIDDTYNVGAAIRISGNVRDIITPENTLIFKLVSGEIVTIHANSESLPIAQATNQGVITVYTVTYNISVEDLERLASSPLAYLRIGIGSERVYDEEFKEKRGVEFQNRAKCMLQ